MSAAPDDTRAYDTNTLIALLRGEMSAVETYTQAVTKLDDQAVIAELQKIRDDHSRAERELRDHVTRSGGQPAEGTGAWSAFASAVAGPATVSTATALAALRQGEEYAVAEYEAALGNEEVHPDCHRLVRTDLLPAGRKHIDELNRLLGGMDN